MTTPDLLEYIEKEENKNISKDNIVSRLLTAGWKQEDVDEAFEVLSKKAAPVVVAPVAIPVSIPAIDPYREVPSTRTSEKQNPVLSPVTPKEVPKVWAPVAMPAPMTDEDLFPNLKPKIETPVQPSVPKVVVPPPTPIAQAPVTPAQTQASPASGLPPTEFKSPLNPILNSYPKDVSALGHLEYTTPKKGVPPFLIWVFGFVALACVFAGLVYANVNGLINIPFLPKGEAPAPITKTPTAPTTTPDPIPETVPTVTPVEVPTTPGDTTPVVPVTDNTAELKGLDTMILSYTSSLETQLYRYYTTHQNSYGKKSNMNGSCVSPTVDSLFYQDPKVVTDKVGVYLSPLLELTNGEGACYSTSKAWAFSVPMATDTKKYFCADSTGFSEFTTNTLSGITCK